MIAATSAAPAGPREKAERPPATVRHARYEGGWYFCWLIERRDRDQREYFGADCSWHSDANEAEWYARKSDAERLAGEMDGIDVVVCEHGFDLTEQNTRAELGLPMKPSLTFVVGTNIDFVIREMLKATAVFHGGDKNAIAKSLGVSRKTVHNWLAEDAGKVT